MTPRHRSAFRALAAGLLLASPTGSALAAQPAPFSILPGATAPAAPVERILLTAQVETWLQMPAPPYNVAVTVKQKLERAGYDVTRDPGAPHDAVLAITYQERPGKTYRFLEQGTRIRCRMVLSNPRGEARGEVIAVDLQTETGAVPMGSLYWDAVQRLEENPYYYFLGELLDGWLTRQEGAAQVFTRALRAPPLSVSTAGEGATTTAREAANALARRAAIEELGRLQDTRALDTLWHLVEQAGQQERHAAVKAIGELGDPSTRGRLLELQERETDPALRATIEASLDRLRGSR